MNLEREIKINKILLILLITLSIGTIALRTSYAMFSKKETFNNVLRIITASELPSSGTEDLIKKTGTSAEEIQGINPETGALCASDCKEYRYTGPSVKNYVKLTNLNPNDVTKTQEELWRIIGVFTDEDTDEKYMRIVRNEILPESYLLEKYRVDFKTYQIKDFEERAHWNYLTITADNDSNNWPIAGLQYYLNGEQDSSGNKGYMSYLSDETKAMLRDTKHYLGTYISGISGNSSSGYTTVESYKKERDVKSCINNKGAVKEKKDFPVTTGCSVWDGNDATWTGKISLMYPSDIGFAASSSYWNSVKLRNYDIYGVKISSWMLQTLTIVYDEWLLSPSDSSSYHTTYWISYNGGNFGHVLGPAVHSSYDVRPVLNIKSNVRIKKGTEGTETNPYIFEI